MSNETVVLKPQQVTATFGDGTLTIHAEGREDGVQQIRIEKLKTMVIPPQFAVVGNRSPAIGNFPYSVDGSFQLNSDPGEIFVSGERVRVQSGSVALQ